MLEQPFGLSHHFMHASASAQATLSLNKTRLLERRKEFTFEFKLKRSFYCVPNHSWNDDHEKWQDFYVACEKSSALSMR